MLDQDKFILPNKANINDKNEAAIRNQLSSPFWMPNNTYKSYVLQKISNLSKKGCWSSGAIAGDATRAGDRGVKGYLDEEFLKNTIGSSNGCTRDTLDIAKMLCFEAICIGISLQTGTRDYSCLESFLNTVDGAKTLERVLDKHPEYFVNKEILRQCSYLENIKFINTDNKDKVKQDESNITDESLKRVREKLSSKKLLSYNSLQKISILQKISKLSKESCWSAAATIGDATRAGDWGVKGYLDTNFLKKALGGNICTDMELKIAKILCFNAICTGISLQNGTRDYSCLKGFLNTTDGRSVVQEIMNKYPQYLVSNKIQDYCKKLFKNFPKVEKSYLSKFNEIEKNVSNFYGDNLSNTEKILQQINNPEILAKSDSEFKSEVLKILSAEDKNNSVKYLADKFYILASFMNNLSKSQIGSKSKFLRDQANKFYKQSLTEFKTILGSNEIEKLSEKELAEIYYKLAFIYKNTGNNDEALLYGLKALEMRKEIGYANSYNDIKESNAQINDICSDLNIVYKKYKSTDKTRIKTNISKKFLEYSYSSCPGFKEEYDLGEISELTQSISECYKTNYPLKSKAYENISNFLKDPMSDQFKGNVPVIKPWSCKEKENGSIIDTYKVMIELRYSPAKIKGYDILEKIASLSKNGDWSAGRFVGNATKVGGDWGVKGYSDEDFLKGILSGNNECTDKELKIAKMLCFEAICYGIAYQDLGERNYKCLDEFIKENVDIAENIIKTHPEYFVEESIIKYCKDKKYVTNIGDLILPYCDPDLLDNNFVELSSNNDQNFYNEVNEEFKLEKTEEELLLNDDFEDSDNYGAPQIAGSNSNLLFDHSQFDNTYPEAQIKTE